MLDRLLTSSPHLSRRRRARDAAAEVEPLEARAVVEESQQHGVRVRQDHVRQHELLQQRELHDDPADQMHAGNIDVKAPARTDTEAPQ